MHNRDQLENIRRKAPATRKSVQSTACEDPSAYQAAISLVEEFKAQLQRLRDAQKGIDVQLERNDTMCQELVAQVGKLHGKLMEYEDIIQNLLVRLAQKEFEERMYDTGQKISAVTKSKCANCGGDSLEIKKRGNGNGGCDTGKGVDHNEDIDEYEDMAEDMDDQDDDDDVSANDDHIQTNTSSRSQGLTPFIIENSTPLAQSYDPVERDAGGQEPVPMDVDEITGSRNWAVGPFDPGGVHSGWSDRKGDGRSYPGDSQSKSMFDILLSKSVSDDQSWLRIQDPASRLQNQKQSSGSVSVVMSSPTTTSLQSLASPANDIVEDLKAANGQTGVLEARRHKRSERIGHDMLFSLPPQSPGVVKKEEVKIEIDVHQRQWCPPLPITETKPCLQSLSTVKQTPDTDKGKRKDQGETAVEMPPILPGYSPPSHTAPILVVDDDPQCRRLLMLFFAYNKQEIDCAVCATPYTFLKQTNVKQSDGISAVEKHKRYKYSIIFMDVILPYLDGVSATRLIRETDQETPIVCLASTSNVSDFDRYRLHGE